MNKALTHASLSFWSLEYPIHILLTQTRYFSLMAFDIYNFSLVKMVSYQYLISYPMFGELKLEKNRT